MNGLKQGDGTLFILNVTMDGRHQDGPSLVVKVIRVCFNMLLYTGTATYGMIQQPPEAA